MQNPMAAVSLVIAVGAAGLAGYALTNEPPATTEMEARLASVEDQLSRVEQELAGVQRETQAPPSLMGLTPPSADDAPTPVGVARPYVGSETDSTGVTVTPNATSKAEDAAALRHLVDVAVEKKAAQLQTMRNKKPSIDVFAETLGLTEDQRTTVERGVVASQHEIRSILELEREDGSTFLNEFVEVFADGIANPGKHPGRGKALFTRLVSEKIPGSDETYAQRVESVKARLRGSLQRELTPKQHSAFQAWRMDPTEIKDIEGSPWKELEGRILERARELGAELPAGDSKR